MATVGDNKNRRKYMATVGDKKQEEKISELAKIAKELFPHVNEMAIKGGFRYGAQAAIEKSRFSSWAEVAGQAESERKKFFDALIQESRSHFESMMNRAEVDAFIKRIKVENLKYLKK